jgi:hypothetical protein
MTNSNALKYYAKAQRGDCDAPRMDRPNKRYFALAAPRRASSGVRQRSPLVCVHRGPFDRMSRQIDLFF